jgi:hypothetical protein
MDEKITLNADESQRSLESAIRTQAQVVLESSVIPHATINGCLISGDERALLMEITGRPARDPSALVNAIAHVQLYSDRRYGFSTTVTAVPQWGQTRALALDRPAVMTVIDRRRFVRARLAPSSHLKLEWRHATVDHRCIATLLNISTDGIACRVEGPAAPPIEVGDTMRTWFTMPGQDLAFDLSAAVSNVTPASGGSTILGLQFDRSTKTCSQIDRLRESLRTTRKTKAPSRVLV